MIYTVTFNPSLDYILDLTEFERNQVNRTTGEKILPGGKGIGAGIMLALIMEGSREKVLALRENPAVKMMQIFDDTGNIDLDKLYNAARPRFENKLTVSVPLLGDMRFDQNDVDKLYRYIQEA